MSDTPRVTMIVLHRNQMSDFGESISDKANGYDLSKYTAVATTEKFMTLDDLYRLTNHIEDNWTKNPEVSPLHPFPRSTSVDDIIVDLFDPFKVSYFRIASFGFERIEVTNTCSLDKLLGAALCN